MNQTRHAGAKKTMGRKSGLMSKAYRNVGGVIIRHCPPQSGAAWWVNWGVGFTKTQ